MEFQSRSVSMVQDLCSAFGLRFNSLESFHVKDDGHVKMIVRINGEVEYIDTYVQKSDSLRTRLFFLLRYCKWAV